MTDATREAAGPLDAIRSLRTAAIALCGLAIVILSFLTWVRFEAAGALPSSTSRRRDQRRRDQHLRDDESIDEHVTARAGSAGAPATSSSATVTSRRRWAWR